MKKHGCALAKRAIAFFMCALFLLCGALSASAQDGGVDFSLGCPDTTEAAAVYVLNLESGKVLASKNPDVALSPSATVKMMTGLIALEHFGDDLSQKISVSSAMLTGVSGNSMGIEAGEAYSAEQLLYALICGGYNDAAAVLAHAVGGSESAFVRKMNERAMEWGMISTTYANPSGIKSAALTTLADVVVLSKRAYENEKYLEISSAMRYEIAADADSAAHTVTNRNALIYGREVEYRNVYASGLCAGTDGEAGYCVSTVAKKGELSYLCIVMGSYRAGDDTYSYIVANRLISWALSSFEYRTVIDKERFSYPVKVELSDTVSQIDAAPQESVSAFLPTLLEDGELEFHVRLHSPSAKAPIKAGDELGYLIVTVGDEEIARTLLVSESDVVASTFMVIMRRLGEISQSRFFIIFMIAFFSVGSAAIVILTILNERMKKKNRYKYKF